MKIQTIKDRGNWVADQTGDNVLYLKPIPYGMYHSATGLSSMLPGDRITPEINGKDYVSGTLLRIAWSEVHTAPGIFDWSLLDSEFQLAEELDTNITLGIIDGFSAPQFVKDASETFEYDFQGSPVTSCLPWDTTYQSYKKELLDAAAARYDNNERLRLVYITYGSMTNGIEMHWRVDEQDFTAAGYTPQRLLDAYTDVGDLYLDAFKRTPLGMEIHEVFESGDLAIGAYNYLAPKSNNRVGAAIWWAAERLVYNGEELIWPVAQQSAEQSFLVHQSVGNFTNQPDRFDEGKGWTSLQAIQSEYSFFIENGPTLYEVWTADIENDDLAPEVINMNNNIIRNL